MARSMVPTSLSFGRKRGFPPEVIAVTLYAVIMTFVIIITELAA